MKPIWLDESLCWIGTILLPTSLDPTCAFEGGMSVRFKQPSKIGIGTSLMEHNGKWVFMIFWPRVVSDGYTATKLASSV